MQPLAEKSTRRGRAHTASLMCRMSGERKGEQMRDLYCRCKNSRLPWLLFYAGLTIELLMVIVDKSNYTNPIEGQLFRITFLFFALKLILTDYTLKEWGVIAGSGLVCVIPCDRRQRPDPPCHFRGGV